MISSGTLKTLYTLKDAGYEAYMVGGGVRDLLAGCEPKDFDVATNAHPEVVKTLFRSCRLVGRRFVICHVRFGGEIVEVTTFRGAITDLHERDETGRILSDNEYGTLEEDAFRRDFTVNALYYDIRDYSIIDFAGGVDDLRAGMLRLIGDPELRYREDPVRMLRAIRIANKLHFRLEERTAEPILRLAPLLREIPPARLFDEVLKLLLSRDAVDNLYGMRVYGLFRQMFPLVERALGSRRALDFVEAALHNTAERIAAEQTVSPTFMYAALLWPAVEARANQLSKRNDVPWALALAEAADDVISDTTVSVAIPKRYSLPMREIWQLQSRFDQRTPGRAKRLLTHPRFRAAYDFLLLRAASGEIDPGIAEWWTQLQELPADARLAEVEGQPATGEAPPRRRSRSRRRRKRPAAST
jgi:poly(A) polymerase